MFAGRTFVYGQPAQVLLWAQIKAAVRADAFAGIWVLIRMRVNICCCLFVLALGCNLTAGKKGIKIIHLLLLQLEQLPCFIHCGRSAHFMVEISLHSWSFIIWMFLNLNIYTVESTSFCVRQCKTVRLIKNNLSLKLNLLNFVFTRWFPQNLSFENCCKYTSCVWLMSSVQHLPFCWRRQPWEHRVCTLVSSPPKGLCGFSMNSLPGRCASLVCSVKRDHGWILQSRKPQTYSLSYVLGFEKKH